MSALGSGARWLGRRLLDLLAVAGVLCIVLAVAAVVLRITVVMFATGSMAPTIPAGSAAIVREAPASEVRVGDVVTVDRPGELPITHRVTAVLGGDGETVEFTMQGDANETPDAQPYRAERVRIVLWSVPGVAPAIAAVQQPAVLGCVTLAMAGLVTWAFWPRRVPEHDAGEDEPGDEPEDGPGAEPDAEPMPRAAAD